MAVPSPVLEITLLHVPFRQRNNEKKKTRIALSLRKVHEKGIPRMYYAARFVVPICVLSSRFKGPSFTSLRYMYIELTM